MKELYYFVLLLLVKIGPNIMALSCPSSQVIFPCVCNVTNSEFKCGNTITTGLVLKQIFQESSRQTNKEVLLNKFIFETSIIEQIESYTLDKFSFRELSVIRNDYLNSIDENAFHSTYNITDKVYFESNPSLGHSDEGSTNLFGVLSRFRNASLIHVIDCGLQYIPDNAFLPLLGVQSRLQRLSLERNRIKSIGNFAFSNLPNINFLNLKQNLIQSLGKLSLTLSDSSEVIFIDLSKNRLTSSSFNSQSLSSIGRPFHLQLSDNSITYLNESIFKPLFKRYIKLILWRNPINCSECLMKWTTNEKHCEVSNNTISYAQLFEFQCKLFKENFKKCQNDSTTNEEYFDNPLSCPLVSNSSEVFHQLHDYFIYYCIAFIFFKELKVFL